MIVMIRPQQVLPLPKTERETLIFKYIFVTQGILVFDDLFLKNRQDSTYFFQFSNLKECYTVDNVDGQI